MDNYLEWTTDLQGLVSGCEYHDRVISKVSYEIGTNIIVEWGGSSGQAIRCILENPLEFGIVFNRNAIISDIFVWHLSDIPDFVPGSHDSPLAIIYGQEAIDEPGKLKDFCISKYGSKFMAQILCSYGENISVICDKVNFQYKEAM